MSRPWEELMRYRWGYRWNFPPA